MKCQKRFNNPEDVQAECHIYSASERQDLLEQLAHQSRGP